MLTYFITTDSNDFLTDDGDDQTSLMTQRVYSDSPLTDEDAIIKAETEGNWKIYFGEGDADRVGSYTVERL